MASVTYEHVTKRFAGETLAVNDLSLEILDGEFMVLVGPSGCGKSTALRMLAGLEEITEGDIKIADRVVNDLPARDRDIAMVFQSYALYPHMSVYDNMAFGLKMRGTPKSEIDGKVRNAARMLGLENFLKRKPRQLSGGQRQRVALGRAIVRNPQVFLLDEPLSNLDAKLRVQTRAEITKIHQRVQTTFIYVTHDQTEAMTMGTRIAVLNAGYIQQIGPPQELYDHPSNLFVAGFIGSPAMNFFNDVSVVNDGDSTKIVIPTLGQVEIPPLYKQQAREAAGKKLTLGIRPEHFEDEAMLPPDALDSSSLTANIEIVEHLGSELLVYMTGKDRQIVARLDPRSGARVGESLKLHIEAENVHLFDSETGEALF